MTADSIPAAAEFRIRRAVLADEAAILEMVPRLVAFGPPAWREPKSMTRADLKVIRAALRSTDADTAVLVAVNSNDGVAAFIHLHSEDDYYTECKHGHVADVVVAEKFEGRGLARMLLAAADEWAIAKGYAWLTIGVFEDNTRAAALYECLGYRRDIIRMLKPLK